MSASNQLARHGHYPPLHAPRPCVSIRSDWLPLVGAMSVWVPAMIASSSVWGQGGLYGHGWIVPPAAVWLMVRRWQRNTGAMSRPRTWALGVWVAVLLPWMLLLLARGQAVPMGRLPTLVLGLTAVVTSHGLIGAARGWRRSAEYGCITLLWLSAVPWPTVVEARIVHELTQGVVTSVSEWFQLFDRPVLAVGDCLCLGQVTVEVREGCSGVRSFQSFLMATWYFAELQRLSLTRTFCLLGCGCTMAFVANIGRVYFLAQIRFNQGQDAFVRAHDWVGLLAFVICALVFYMISGMMARPPRRKLVRTVQVH